MNKVLQFPKEQTKRVDRQRKIAGQKAVLTLSLFSFVLVAIMANESVVRDQRPIFILAGEKPSLQEMNRAIASAQPLHTFRDLELERRLAERLRQDLREPASLSEVPTLREQLQFGLLAGKYRMATESTDQKQGVTEIEYVESAEITDRPVFVNHREAFLKDYASLFAVDFQDVQPAAISADRKPSSQGEEVWDLVGSAGRPVGEARFKFDERGALLRLQIKKHQE